MRFEDFIERTSRTLQAAGVKRKRDPRVFLYLSMVMLEFNDALEPGRRRVPDPGSGARCTVTSDSSALTPTRSVSASPGCLGYDLRR
jgi:hypothetical protein